MKRFKIYLDTSISINFQKYLLQEEIVTKKWETVVIVPSLQFCFRTLNQNLLSGYLFIFFLVKRNWKVCYYFRLLKALNGYFYWNFPINGPSQTIFIVLIIFLLGLRRGSILLHCCQIRLDMNKISFLKLNILLEMLVKRNEYFTVE